MGYNDKCEVYCTACNKTDTMTLYNPDEPVKVGFSVCTIDGDITRREWCNGLDTVTVTKVLECSEDGT